MTVLSRTVPDMNDGNELSASSDGLAVPDSPWSMLEAVDSGIAVTRPDGTVVFANRLLSDLTGTPVPAIVGSPAFALFDSERRTALEQLHAAALAISAPQRTDAGGPAGGATRFSATVVLRRSEQSRGPVVVWAVRALEKTVPEQGPRFGREGADVSKSLLDVALRGTEIGLWDWDIATDNLTWLNNWCEQWRLTDFAESGHERLWTARMHKDDLPGYRAALESHLADTTHIFDVEYRVRDRQDDWVWVQERGRVIERDATGRSVRMVGLCLYVDERHRTAHALALARSESRFELALWGTQVGFWDVNAVTGELHWWNDWCASINVHSCDGFEHSLRWNEQIHPDDLPFAMGYDALIEGRTDVYEAEYRLRTRNGEWRWVLCRARATARGSDGRALRLAGVTIDIDSHKRTELALRESEVRLEAAVWGTNIGLWEGRSDGTFRFLNDWCDRFDIDPCYGPDQRARWRAQIHPNDVERFAQADDGYHVGSVNQYEIEYRVRTRSGQWRWLLDRGRVVERAPDGAPTKAVGISLDIDVQKRMEMDLRESEQRFRGAFEFAAIGMALVAPDGRWLRANKSLCEILGYTAEELLATDFQSITHAEDLDADIGQMRQMLDGSLSHYNMEKRYLHKDGHIVWVLLSASLVRDARAQSMYFVAQIQDITDRKHAEGRLIESELRYRTVANLVPGFVFEGIVRDGYPYPTWVSDGFARVYGCTLDRFVELGGKGFYDATARAQILAGASAMASGSNLDFTVSLTNAHGVERWLRVVARSVRSGSGSGAHRVLGVAEDITERKRLERALREATHREHQRLGQEIHDGLGQELTGLAYLASSLASEAARSGSPLADDLTKLAEVTRHSIETCRNVARGVSPLTETRGSLVRSLRQIAGIAAAGGHASVNFGAIENAPLTLPSESRDHLHRITQEAVNNALKHSDADNIGVTIRIDSTLVRIEVVDNGRGLRPTGAAQIGLGIDGMRQRAATIGARLRVETRPSGGAAVVCECPQSAPSETPAT
jgi:PAS domain S-box-containing protein